MSVGRTEELAQTLPRGMHDGDKACFGRAAPDGPPDRGARPACALAGHGLLMPSTLPPARCLSAVLTVMRFSP